MRTASSSARSLPRGAADVSARPHDDEAGATREGTLSLSMKVLAEQQADREEHETFDYKETGTVSTGLGDLLKGLKL